MVLTQGACKTHQCLGLTPEVFITVSNDNPGTGYFLYFFPGDLLGLTTALILFPLLTEKQQP